MTPYKPYIIRLKGHDKSESLAKDCIQQAAKFNIFPKYFDAIWGKDHEEHSAKTGLKFMQGYPKDMTLAHYGNFYSHYYLWESCIRINRPILVLEHDGYFIRPIPNDVLDNFTHILKLDSENPYNGNYEKELIKKKNNQDSYIKDVTGIHKKKWFGWYTTGAYCYILKPEGAKTLINFVKEKGFISTDNLFADGIMPITLITPSVVRLHPGFSGSKIHTLSTKIEMGKPKI